VKALLGIALVIRCFLRLRHSPCRIAPAGLLRMDISCALASMTTTKRKQARLASLKIGKPSVMMDAYL
jgi:hypothetical protein